MGRYDPKLTWFLTYPQCSCSLSDFLELLNGSTLDHREYIIAQEKHKDGSSHLHVYLKLKPPGVVWEQSKKGEKPKDSDKAPLIFNLLPKSGNYQPCRGPKAVMKYVTKEDPNYLSSFDVSAIVKKKKKLDTATIRAKCAREAMDDGDIHFTHVKQYNVARSTLLRPFQPDYHHLRGVWIHGQPGSGKTSGVRMKFPGCYDKPQSKWWDDYEGQKVVLLDDLDSSVLSHYLKRWMDVYPCSGEVKGSITQLQHRLFIVTSNYLPEQIFCNRDGSPDETLSSAIRRRCTIIDKNDPDVPIDWSPVHMFDIFEDQTNEESTSGTNVEPPNQPTLEEEHNEIDELYELVQAESDAIVSNEVTQTQS